VVVVGLDDGPDAAWGPFVLACLPATRFRRVGAVLSHVENGAYRAELVDEVHRLPEPERDQRAFADALAALVAETGAKAVIAGSPRAVPAVAAAAKRLRAAGAAAIAGPPARLRKFANRPPVRAGTPVFEAAVVCGAGGRVRACAAVRVIASDARARPWVAVTVDDPALFRAARKVAAAVRGTGPFVIRFEAGGAWRAADARPGFPTWVEAAHAAGVPLVHAALPRPLRPSAPRRKPEAGILFSQTAEDLAIDLLQPARLARAAGC
jgi:hypothetical protein